MPNKFLLTLRLMRADKPTGYLLVFFPALFGLLLAKPSNLELINLLPLFILGSITTRSAGCVINDLFDRNFDKHVARTKDRPLASGKLSVSYAFIVLAFLSACSLCILLFLNKTCIYLGCAAVIMIAAYPLMKRITYFPQLFLGCTFNLGALFGYAAITSKITISSFFMYLACCSWQWGYDTIYGFMDLKDDKKINVKSMAIWLENRNYKIYLAGFYIFFIQIFTIIYPINILFSFLALILLTWQAATLNIYNPANCLSRFKNNNYVGLILSLGCFFANFG